MNQGINKSTNQQINMWVAAIRSVAAYVVVSLYVLVVAPPGMLIALAIKSSDILYVLGHLGVRLALGLAGIRYRVIGAEHLIHDRAAMYVANHQSNVDPLVCFRALHPRLKVMYKAELSRLGLLERAFRLGGFLPVDRKNREHARIAVEEGARKLSAGESFLIFPEGTRSRTAALLPFKKGGFVMALKAQVPIVPVAVTGGLGAMRRGSAIIRPVRMTLKVGAPIETAGMTLNDRDALVDRVRADIEKLLGDPTVLA
jgi:1-acyl-sn-glycerol-3-phosphate acyltransferase